MLQLPAPWTAIPGGVRLAIRLTPRARREGVDGAVTGADGQASLQVRLAAPPVDGAANAALIAWLARALDVRKADVTLRSGEKSRSKVLDIAGEPGRLTAALARLAHSRPPG